MGLHRKRYQDNFEKSSKDIRLPFARKNETTATNNEIFSLSLAVEKKRKNNNIFLHAAFSTNLV